MGCRNAPLRFSELAKIEKRFPMTMHVELTPKTEAGLLSQAASPEAFVAKVLEDIIGESLPVEDSGAYAEAMHRLGTFGKRHKLSLGEMSVKELLRESRP